MNLTGYWFCSTFDSIPFAPFERYLFFIKFNLSIHLEMDQVREHLEDLNRKLNPHPRTNQPSYNNGSSHNGYSNGRQNQGPQNRNSANSNRRPGFGAQTNGTDQSKHFYNIFSVYSFITFWCFELTFCLLLQIGIKTENTGVNKEVCFEYAVFWTLQLNNFI